jgi:hypothetical protein
MLNITATAPAYLDISGMNFVLATSQGGAAPAAMPADPPTLRQLHEDEPVNEGWSS